MLHIIALPVLLSTKPSNALTTPTAIEVSFEPRSNSPQIVSPPDSKEAPEPPDTSRLSDKNFVAEREMIRHGMPAASGPSAPPAPESQRSVPQPANEKTEKQPSKSEDPKPLKQQTEPRAPERPSDAEVSLREKQTQQAALKSASLRLSNDALMNTFASELRRASPESAARPQPFSRAPGAGAAFFGSGGTPDYLPSLPDGDMTLLNAKASKYATFVRRVAVQVFAALRTQGWESLSGSEINAAGASTLARAILSKKGDFLSVQIVTRSGSASFDAVVASSIKTGARDPNPPVDAAADDGTYRFIFEARSWAVRASDPRTRAPSERRWLMLGTGLE